MPKFYRRAMGPTLRARVEEALAAPATEQMMLNEELALMREGAANAVRFYSDAEQMHAAAVAAGNQALSNETRQLVLDAASLMHDHLEKVGDYVVRIARAEALSKDNITAPAVYGILAQVTRIFYIVCGEEHEHLAREVERRIREEVRIPGAATAQEGTHLTPDATVLEMDATVPDAD